MSDGILTQEEIDALLSSVMAEEEGSAGAGDSLTEKEIEAVGEAAGVVMEAAAAALSTLLEREVEISGPVIQILDPETLRQRSAKSFVVCNLEYVGALAGVHAVLVETGDAVAVVDLMMGGNGQASSSLLESKDLDALKEAFNQMLNAGANALAGVVKNNVEITSLNLETKDLAREELGGYLGQKDQTLVRINFRFLVNGVFDSELLLVYPFGLAKSIARMILGDAAPDAVEEKKVSSAGQTTASASVNPAFPFDNPTQPAAAGPVGGFAPPPPPQQQVPVQPVQFAPLTPGYQPKEIANIELIMDVPLQITVELGKTRKTIREILALGPGSVVELDKLAGEPVDLLVNGKLLAKGEVVVIDEKFGIRVTDIISPVERITNLQ